MAADRLLHRHFRGIGESLERDSIAEKVVLLDGLWGTRLFMERGAADRIVANLEKEAGRLAELLCSLAVDDLERRPGEVVRVAQAALPVILVQVRGQREAYRQNYSFATKFWHWVTKHHFPIVDSRARQQVNALQVEMGVLPRVRSSTAAMGGLTYVEEYARWVSFFSDLVAGLSGVDRDRLLRADHDSQPRRPSPPRNSLLRVLDKAFYTEGGGSGMGRTEG